MLNKVILIGNVGQDPDIRVMPNGNRVANFSIATSEYRKDKDGNKTTVSEWHKIVVYTENLIKIIEKYVKKGSKLYLEGSIKSRKYNDKDGIEKSIYEITVQSYSDTIKLLDSKAQSESFGDNDKKTNFNNEKTITDKDFSSGNNEPEDEDIPF